MYEIILGRQRRESRDGGEGEERGLRKGAEKRDKRELSYNLKRRIRNIDTCLCLLFSFLKALSSRLDSAVKCCSIAIVLVSSSRLGKGSGLKRLVKY